MVNTFVATAAAGLSWMIVEFVFKWKMSLLGLVSGVVAGLVAVTPAAGFVGPMGAAILGAVAGVVCLFFCTAIKWLFRYDDSLDVFGIHCIGGIVGALGTGLLVSPEFGGTGILDYVVNPGAAKVAEYVRDVQLIAQAKAVGLTLLWSGIGSASSSRSWISSSVPASIRKQSKPASTCRSTASAATSTSTEATNTPAA